MALIRPLAWEPPYAAGAAQEIAKRQKKKKKKKGQKKVVGEWLEEEWSFPGRALVIFDGKLLGAKGQ